MLDFLLEEDEDEGAEANADLDDDLMLGGISDENQQLLAELKEEDKKNAKKKDKKEKKGKKGKKGKDKEGGDEGEGAEEEEIKKKKPKKEKKKKKEKKTEEESNVPEKKLSKKKVVSVFLFCTTIAACIVVTTMIVPEQIEKQEARVAYDQNEYKQVYELLYGKKLSEEDAMLLEKSSIILQVERKLESYENYEKMGMPLEALNALVSGAGKYQNLKDEAELYSVDAEVYGLYEQILAALMENYGLSEEDVLEILSLEDNVAYSYQLESIVYGGGLGAEEEEQAAVKQDVLLEEEEIIDRLEGESDTEELQNADVDDAEEAEGDSADDAGQEEAQDESVDDVEQEEL